MKLSRFFPSLALFLCHLNENKNDATSHIKASQCQNALKQTLHPSFHCLIYLSLLACGLPPLAFMTVLQPVNLLTACPWRYLWASSLEPHWWPRPKAVVYPGQIRIHAGKVFTGLIGCVPGQIFVGYFDPSLHLNMFSEWGFANFRIASVIVSNEVDLMTMNGIVRQIISVVVWGGFSPFQVSEQNNTARTVVNRSWNQNYIILHESLSLGTKERTVVEYQRAGIKTKEVYTL